MCSKSNKPHHPACVGHPGHRGRISRRAGIAVAAAGLLWAASRLDPTHEARVAKEHSVLAARREEDAKARELVPESGEVTRGTRRVTFSDLAFEVPQGEAKAAAKTGFAPWLPEAVKALDGRRVRIEGYMLPTQMEDGKAKECLILANQLACCYGRSPRFCEFFVGRVKGAAVPALQDRPLVFKGRLKVADVFEGGAWMSLYELELDSVRR